MVTTSITLLDRFRDPEDAAAWSRFVEIYAPLIYRWVGRTGVATSDAADVVQEVFVALAQKLPTFEYDPKRSFGAWLRTVTSNKCRSFLRRQRRFVALPADGVPQHRDIATAFDDDEYRNFVARRALQIMQTEFEATTWQACWQTVVESRPAGEIAKSLGISVNAVYLAKGRVLRRLREQLDGIWE